MNYESLKKFLVVAKNLNITTSANELFISQPALSKSIKDLESELNCKLFVRKNNGLILTEAGLSLYNNIKKSFLELDKVLESFSLNKRAISKLRIGTSLTIAKKFLTDKLYKFTQLYPEVKLELKSLRTIDCIEELKENKIDLFLTNTEIGNKYNFKVYDIKTLHECLICGNAFKHLLTEKFNFEDLKYYSLITNTSSSVTRKSFEAFCKELNIQLTPSYEVENNSFLSEMVKLNMGIGYTTYEFIQDEIDNNTLFELSTIQKLPTRKMTLVTNKQIDNLQLFKTLLNIILED